MVEAYDGSLRLEEASTIPSAWYTDPRIAELERLSVFGQTWQVAGRAEQVKQPGQFFTADIAGEPVVVVRGNDGRLRGFFNVCRHHAAAVVTKAEGNAAHLRCPYHGWTYSLEGELKGTPDFDGVGHFDKSKNGLLQVPAETWEQFVFVRLAGDPMPLPEFFGSLVARVRPLAFGDLSFQERRVYTLDCNWKVFVDNYLDGGYHVPYLHKGLNSVLDYSKYTIETEDRYCLQWSPVQAEGAGTSIAAVRRGERAFYFWLYPNFMMNWYEGTLDTNLVLPLGIDRTQVIFDFYFADVSEGARARNRESIAVSERVQDEDVSICESVQRGLRSRAYDTGRLSVRREAGEHLFHRLLHADLVRGMDSVGDEFLSSSSR